MTIMSIWVIIQVNKSFERAMYMVHENSIQITKYNVFGKLPNLFKFNDGTDVKTPEDFERKKQEIIKDAFPIQYGELPPEPEFLEVELVHWHWTNTMATYQVTTGTRENPITFFMYYKTARKDPKNQPKNPVVIDGDFCWANARITKEYADAYINNNVDLLLFDRTAFSHDVCGERRKDGRGHGQVHRTYPDLDIGQLGAWAWAYSRCIDALEKLDICDLSCIAVTGHSRGGKTALLAGILDKRIAITNPNSSCIGGGGCYRIDIEVTDEKGRPNRKSERIDWFIDAGTIDWFGTKLASYMDREDELPFDTHSLKALVAPRILFVSEGASDISANPVGSWQTNLAANEVYKLYGKEENMLWYFRNGDHDHTVGDVEQLCNIIKREKFGEPLNDNFFKVPFKPMELAFDWRCPEK